MDTFNTVATTAGANNINNKTTWYDIQSDTSFFGEFANDNWNGGFAWTEAPAPLQDNLTAPGAPPASLRRGSAANPSFGSVRALVVASATSEHYAVANQAIQDDLFAAFDRWMPRDVWESAKPVAPLEAWALDWIVGAAAPLNTAFLFRMDKVSPSGA